MSGQEVQSLLWKYRELNKMVIYDIGPEEPQDLVKRLLRYSDAPHGQREEYNPKAFDTVTRVGLR